MKRISLLLLLACIITLLVWPDHVHAYEIGAVVIAVHDGDTLTVRYDHPTTLPTTIRFYLVDAPELRTQFGAVAAQYTRSRLLNRHVTITHWKRCSKGRLLANVSTNDTPFALELLRQGFGRVLILHDEEHTWRSAAWAALHEAQAAHRGIW